MKRCALLFLIACCTCTWRVDPIGRPVLGKLCKRRPTPRATELTATGVFAELRRAEDLAASDAKAAAELLYEPLAFVVPELRGLGLKRAVELNLLDEGALDRRAVGVSGTQFMAMPVDEEHARLGSYDFIEDRLVAQTTGYATLTYVHEMAHALVDQHFNLARLFDATRGDSDARLALGSLVEGDANLVAFTYFHSMCDPDFALRVQPTQLDEFFANWWGYVPDDELLERTDPSRRVALTKAYAGTHFAARLARAGGWAAINAAYDHLPASTEQILHPEKFLDQDDLPIEVEVPPSLPKRTGWRLADEDTIGELRIRHLFGREAAAGWGGDTYRRYLHKNRDEAVVWVSIWDSEEEAAEFARAYAQKRGVPIGDSLTVRHNLGPIFDNRSVEIVWDGSQVTIIDGFLDADIDTIETRLADVRFHIKPNPMDRYTARRLRDQRLETRCATRARVTATLDVMTLGARDCKVRLQDYDLGFAPVANYKSPVGRCEIEVTCADGQHYRGLKRLRPGRNTVVIRHQDWD